MKPREREETGEQEEFRDLHRRPEAALDTAASQHSLALPKKAIVHGRLRGRSYKAYRGMGAVGAMARGSADRYFQQDIKDTLKLEPAIEQLAVRDSRAARSSILTVITFSGSSRPRRT